ncbi:endonuclease/exonuclease/phosphatase family protein [Micromonospora sp. C51]|uniref:endonuclease/exonuclease/phosphatase family protein n=1 Tax=Micromonospora sp. C51 TaxID=2824879 RepID=UPI0027DACA80|nr:endonuclease/exonuclease/phosphatase family protein [Micromonospora sp. C51]
MLLPTTAAEAAAPPGTNLQLLTWNICGSQRANWGCSSFGTWADKNAVIQAQIQDNYVQAMLLQEICENDLASLMTTLGSGWTRSFAPYQWASKGVLTNNRCGEDNSPRGDRIGTAIVIKAGSSNAQTIATTQPWDGQQRPFHCATATYFNDIRLCNVHLSPPGSDTRDSSWEYSDDQLGEIKKVVDGYPNVAFGGDFNILPPDHVYPVNDENNPDRGWIWDAKDGNPYPRYRECDQTNPAGGGRPTNTRGEKIDYVFSSRPWRWCAVTPTAFSDHYPLVYSMQIA